MATGAHSEHCASHSRQPGKRAALWADAPVKPLLSSFQPDALAATQTFNPAASGVVAGNKITVASDDPITNVRISRLNREQAIVDQYRENIGAVKIRLAKNETYLTGMVNDLGAVASEHGGERAVITACGN